MNENKDASNVERLRKMAKTGKKTKSKQIRKSYVGSDT